MGCVCGDIRVVLFLQLKSSPAKTLIKQQCIPVGFVPSLQWLSLLPCIPPLPHCHTRPLSCMPLAMHVPCHAIPLTTHTPLPFMPSSMQAPQHVCPLPCTPPAMHAPLPHKPPARITDKCKNITFPQLLLRAVFGCCTYTGSYFSIKCK